MTYMMMIQSSRYATTKLRLIWPILAQHSVYGETYGESALWSRETVTRPAFGNVYNLGLSCALCGDSQSGIIEVQARMGVEIRRVKIDSQRLTETSSTAAATLRDTSVLAFDLETLMFSTSP